MKKQHQPLYSMPNYYQTAMNYPLALYITTQSALFIPPTCHVRFNPSVRRHAVKFCCEMFFTYPVILLAHNSILMLRKREGRPSSGGGRIVMALKSFSEKLHNVIYSI